jgi:hypothetical protein
MNQLTLRRITLPLEKALRAEQRRRGRSLNQIVLSLLQNALGLNPSVPYDNGLSSLAGTWREVDLKRFKKATAPFERIDKELWE